MQSKAPRPLEEINQEYTQVCASIGDAVMQFILRVQHALGLNAEAAATKAQEVKIETP